MTYLNLEQEEKWNFCDERNRPYHSLAEETKLIKIQSFVRIRKFSGDFNARFDLLFVFRKIRISQRQSVAVNAQRIAAFQLITLLRGELCASAPLYSLCNNHFEARADTSDTMILKLQKVWRSFKDAKLHAGSRLCAPVCIIGVHTLLASARYHRNPPPCFRKKTTERVDGWRR